MKWNKVKTGMYKNNQTFHGEVFVFRVAELDGIVWQTSFDNNSYATAKEAKQALDDLTCYTLFLKSQAA
jgi:hypothetical protein